MVMASPILESSERSWLLDDNETGNGDGTTGGDALLALAVTNDIPSPETGTTTGRQMSALFAAASGIWT